MDSSVQSAPDKTVTTNGKRIPERDQERSFREFIFAHVSAPASVIFFRPQTDAAVAVVVEVAGRRTYRRSDVIARVRFFIINLVRVLWLTWMNVMHWPAAKESAQLATSDAIHLESPCNRSDQYTTSYLGFIPRQMFTVGNVFHLFGRSLITLVSIKVHLVHQCNVRNLKYLNGV